MKLPPRGPECRCPDGGVDRTAERPVRPRPLADSLPLHRYHRPKEARLCENAAAAAPKLTMPVHFVAALDDGGAVATARGLGRRATASSDAKVTTFDRGGHGWALLKPDGLAQLSVDNLLDTIA